MGVHASAEPIRPIVAPEGLDPARVTLGRRLFADPRLSADDTVSCASCHDLTRAGVDDRKVARGIRGAEGLVNTPTVFNAHLNPKQFWDGRADSLEDQIDGPIHNQAEMGASWPLILSKLAGDRNLVAAFQRSYADGLQARNIKDALATFERSLVTTDSRFDRHLAGVPGALSPAELEGYALFKSYGCVSCHQGRNVGGNVFEHLGVFGDYFQDRGGPVTVADLGRFNVTRRQEDRFKFRVPSLRLVTHTSPYFHDGQVGTLTEAIRIMGRYQLGLEIPRGDIERIAAFLGTLSAHNQSEVVDAGR